MAGKKGQTIIAENVIFILLNLVFAMMLLFFVWNSGSGATEYEQVYSKQIALAIDSARPNTAITLPFDDGVSIAAKNGMPLENVLNIDSAQGIVTVKLSPSGKGYSFPYFSDMAVQQKIDAGSKLITLLVQEKPNG